MRNERLVTDKAVLRDIATWEDDARIANMLDAACEEIAPGMAPETIRWLVPMLEDYARSGACRGDVDFAAQLREIAGSLRDALDELGECPDCGGMLSPAEYCICGRKCQM